MAAIFYNDCPQFDRYIDMANVDAVAGSIRRLIWNHLTQSNIDQGAFVHHHGIQALASGFDRTGQSDRPAPITTTLSMGAT